MTRRMNPFLDEKTLATRIGELGAQISQDFNGEEILCVGVLKGSIVFFADLIRKIDVPLSVDFIGAQSYEGTQSTGHVRITHDLGSDIKDKNILIIEDIVDTGMTLDYILNTLKVREPKSLRVAALLSKPDAHIMKNQLDYVGFEIANEFVVGFGLDLDGQYRQLPFIAQVSD